MPSGKSPLAGAAATSIRGNFTLRKGRVVSSANIEPTFDAAANRRTDVHVIVVDVDQFGVGLISDLHAVFPSAKLVALTSSPRLMVNALRAGASIALPRSTPASTLARVIQRLLGGPAKQVRSRPAKRYTVGGWHS
jgi:DNA-binding NarL/FixJ family response regulator